MNLYVVKCTIFYCVAFLLHPYCLISVTIIMSSMTNQLILNYLFLFACKKYSGSLVLLDHCGCSQARTVEPENEIEIRYLVEFEMRSFFHKTPYFAWLLCFVAKLVCLSL